MLDMIRNWVAPKASVRMILRGTLTMEAGIKLQDLVQSTGLMGSVRLVQGSYADIELEGPRPKLDALVVRLQQTRLISSPTILEVNWMPFQSQFRTFHVMV
jgi:hypothetical protein